MRDRSKWTMPPDILEEAAVQGAASCSACGWTASGDAAFARVRDAAERLLVAETETLERPHHGPVARLRLAPCPSCGHEEMIALSLWWTKEGLCYYARREREWEYVEAPEWWPDS